jgi:hypothetical protein
MSFWQVTSPLVARSLTVKAELSDTENLKYRVEEKNEEILELKKNLKLKVVEIGEINTKVELLGKKLELADEEVWFVKSCDLLSCDGIL